MSSSKVKIPVRCILELLDLMERKHSYSSLPVLRSYTTNMNKCGVSVPFSIIATALSLVTYLSVTPRAQWMAPLCDPEVNTPIRRRTLSTALICSDPVTHGSKKPPTADRAMDRSTAHC